MSADPAERPQLGELLVEKGLITEAQLEHALAAQQQSGAPLGEILVGLGFASAPAMANALADQRGGPLRTEYGFSMGPTRLVGTSLEEPALDRAARAEAAAAQPEQEALQLSLAQHQDALAAARATIETLKTACASAEASVEPLQAQLQQALQEQARQYENLHELEQQLQETHKALADDERTREERESLRQGLEQSQVELATARSTIAALEAQLGQAHAERSEDTEALRLALEQRGVELAEAKAHVAAMEHRLEEITDERGRRDARLRELEHRLDETGVELSGAHEPDTHHVLFVPGTKGYAIVERTGPAPTVGTVVEVDSRQFTVVKLGPSPLPGARGRCAFLAA